MRWLVLAVLALAPAVSFAQRGDGLLSGPATVKIRVGVVAGGILSGKNSAPGVGVQAGAFLRLGKSFDVGVNVFTLGDAREGEGALVVAGEGMLRLLLEEFRPNRLWLELAGGVAQVSEPDVPSRPKGSGGAALTVEIGEKGLGGFVSVGLRVARSDRVFGLPYLGLGLFF
jgi:hypothetical protein